LFVDLLFHIYDVLNIITKIIMNKCEGYFDIVIPT